MKYSLHNVNQEGKNAFAVTISFITLATIVTASRLLARRLIKSPYRLDDLWVMAAWVALLLTAGFEIWGLRFRRSPRSC